MQRSNDEVPLYGLQAAMSASNCATTCCAAGAAVMQPVSNSTMAIAKTFFI
jgi:hypothetical protein